MRTHSLLLLSLLFLTFSSPASAVVHLRGHLTNNRERAGYLLFVQKHIPRILEKAQSGYTIDLFTALEHEDKVLDLVESNAAFKVLEPGKPELQSIKIERLAPRSATNRSVRPEVAAQWSAAIDASVSSIAVAPPSSPVPAARALAGELLFRLSTRDPHGILTGLVNCLPPASRGALFRQAPETQLESLRASAELTEEAVTQGFRADAFGMTAADVSKDALFAAIEQGFSMEANLRSLILFVAEPDVTADQRTFAILRSSNDQLASELLPDSQKPALKKAQQYLARFAQAQAKQLFLSEKAEELAVAETATLREMPPYLGVFRGFIGGDCSTKYSLPYVYSPMERLYFIYDSEGTLKGYAQGTVVTQGTEKAFYLHDITGAELSPALAELALHGLNRLLPELGVSRLVLPTQEKFSNLNHFDALKTLLEKYQSKNEAVGIAYDAEDIELRKEFGRLNKELTNFDWSYDKPEENRSAHVFQPDPELDSAMRATIGPSESPAPEIPDLTREQAITLALDIAGGLRLDDAEEIIKEYRVPKAQWDDAVLTFMNENQLPIAEYAAKIGALYQRLGVEWNEASFREKAPFLRLGIARARDLAANGTAWQKREAASIVVDLMRFEVSGFPAYKIVALNPQVYTASERMQSVARELINGPSWKGSPLGWLVDVGFTPAVTEADLPKMIEWFESDGESRRLVALDAFTRIAPPDRLLVRISAQLTSNSARGRKAALSILFKERSTDSAVNQNLREFATSKKNPVADRLAAVRAVVQNGKGTSSLNETLRQIQGELAGTGHAAERKELRSLNRLLISLLKRCEGALSTLLN